MILSQHAKDEAQRTLPGYMLDGLFAHVEERHPTGGFLTALFENDLMLASQKADDTNRHLLWEYATWLFNYAPSGCYGSRKAVTEWLKGKQEG